MSNFGPRSAYPGWSASETNLLRELFPRAAWPELLAALPSRTRQAIWRMGKNVLKLRREVNRKERWTLDEDMVLRQQYPVASDDILKGYLPRHSFTAIQRRASELWVMRPRHEARQHRRFVHPAILQLYEERHRQHLNRTQFAKVLGYGAGQILSWELGKTSPEFRVLCDWAQALGIEIVVKRPIEKPEAIVIPYPTKRQLMSGR